MKKCLTWCFKLIETGRVNRRQLLFDICDVFMVNELYWRPGGVSTLGIEIVCACNFCAKQLTFDWSVKLFICGGCFMMLSQGLLYVDQ